MSIKPYYDDGQITLYCADNRDVLPLLSATDLVLTDPPYGVREDGWDLMDAEEYARLSMGWLSEARRLSPRLVTFSCGQTYGVLYDLCRMLYPSVRQLVWDKPWGSQYAGSAQDGMWFAHEPILSCGPGKKQAVVLEVAALIREARQAKGVSRGSVDIAMRGKRTGLCYRWEEGACLPTPEQAERLGTLLGIDAAALERLRPLLAAAVAPEGRDVLSYRPVLNSEHPCEKPLGLVRELVAAHLAPSGELVDPFAGTGTTLRAAKDCGRRAIGIERKERYCEITARRLAQSALQLDGPESTPRATALAFALEVPAQ